MDENTLSELQPYDDQEVDDLLGKAIKDADYDLDKCITLLKRNRNPCRPPVKMDITLTISTNQVRERGAVIRRD